MSPSDTCEVVVKALVGGKFQFQEGTEFVSAVYAVAFAKKLLKWKYNIVYSSLMKNS